jgi:hypothetical protein
MVWILIVAVLSALVLVALVSPWRWPDARGAGRGDDRLVHAVTELGDLEAARETKYREIRDTEMDRETGKLSVEDFAIVDAGLRAEAVEILKRLDQARARVEKLQRAEAAERLAAAEPREDAELDPLTELPLESDPAEPAVEHSAGRRSDPE